MHVFERSGASWDEVAVLRAETLRKVLPILTPEQRSKLEQAPSHGDRQRRQRGS